MPFIESQGHNERSALLVGMQYMCIRFYISRREFYLHAEYNCIECFVLQNGTSLNSQSKAMQRGVYIVLGIAKIIKIHFLDGAFNLFRTQKQNLSGAKYLDVVMDGTAQKIPRPLPKFHQHDKFERYWTSIRKALGYAQP